MPNQTLHLKFAKAKPLHLIKGDLIKTSKGYNSINKILNLLFKDY
jgi:hypothetical protein